MKAEVPSSRFHVFTRAGEGFHTHTHSKGENHLLVTREARRLAVIHRNQQEEEQKTMVPADRKVEVGGGGGRNR